jgi:hypothetical protein
VRSVRHWANFTVDTRERAQSKALGNPGCASCAVLLHSSGIHLGDLVSTCRDCRIAGGDTTLRAECGENRPRGGNRGSSIR